MDKIKLTEQQVEDIVYNDKAPEGFEIVDNYSSNNDRRWSRIEYVILQKDDKFYRVYWDKGLTESQDDVFLKQELEEVEKVEVKKYVWNIKK